MILSFEAFSGYREDVRRYDEIGASIYAASADEAEKAIEAHQNAVAAWDAAGPTVVLYQEQPGLSWHHWATYPTIMEAMRATRWPLRSGMARKLGRIEDVMLHERAGAQILA
jgi:hypothetical protein